MKGHIVNSFEKNSHSFIVRFWLEPRELEDAKPVWRGMIEHVASGEKLHLKDLDEIKAFVTTHIKEIGVIP